MSATPYKLLYPELPSRRVFHFMDECKTFVGDASEVFPDGPVRHVVEITIEASGNSKVFEVKEVLAEDDGDVRAWRYRSGDGYALVIYND